MLRSVKQPEVVQIASTDNLERVMASTSEPNNSIAGWLAPWEILLTESYTTIDEALSREQYLKATTYSYNLPDYTDY